MSKVVDIEQLLAEEEEERFSPIERDVDYASVVIVDNLPVIPKVKESKLLGVVKKIFSAFGNVVDVHMPYVSDDKSCGFAFIEYKTPMQAAAAVKNLDNHALDKSHVFRVNHYEDFAVADKYPDEYEEPTDTPFDEIKEDLYSWLLDTQGRDEFAIRYGDDTEIMWNGVGNAPPKSDCKRSKWTDAFVDWSPQGTYLVSMHKQGVVLWGGPEWTKIKRFRHSYVSLIAFSPDEKYLVTLSGALAEQKDPEAIIIWDTLTGQKMRGFPAVPKQWPAFSWSPDSKYFSRVKDGLVAVYETPSMKLVDKKSVRLSGPVQTHAWSPSDLYFAAIIPETGNIPAKVVVVEMPSQRVVGQTTLFNVTDASMLWQDKGDFLLVKADRHKKSKKNTYISFEVFRLREKGVPVESIELTDTIIDFKWELKGGKRFAVIHGATTTATRTSVSFYSCESKSLKKIAELENRMANTLFWSPGGRYCLLAGLKNLNGVFEIYDAQTLTTLADELKHYLCTNVEWDPTGRYFTTFVSYWHNKNENGYKLWTWSGKEVFSHLKSPFHQFIWRPRPPSLLPKDKARWLAKPENFKTFQDKYRQEDRQNALKRIDETRRQREKIRNDFRDRIAKRREEIAADAEWRKAHGVTELTDADYVTVEEVVEEVLEETEEVVTA